MSAAIKVLTRVQLHLRCIRRINVRACMPPVLKNCKKRDKKRRLDNAVAGTRTSKIQSFFVTTTAGEDETSEGNRGNCNDDVVDVAPAVPAPDGQVEVCWSRKEGMYKSGNDNRVYSENSSANHDLKNEVTTYLLSANQKLSNQRLEQPIIN